MEGFLAVQHAVAKAFIEPWLKFDPQLMFDQLRIRRFGYPPYTQDVLLSSMELVLSFIFLLSYVYTCINIVKVIIFHLKKMLISFKVLCLVNNS